MRLPARICSRSSAALLSGGSRRAYAKPVLAGAVIPDLPMFAFYLWERLVSGASEQAIWGRLYFRPGWQDFFDGFNSI